MKKMLINVGRMLTNSRVTAFRIAIQDLYSTFGMLPYFKKLRNAEEELVSMNRDRINGAHFMLVDLKVQKPLDLKT
jgi:hypothetical protein